MPYRVIVRNPDGSFRYHVDDVADGKLEKVAEAKAAAEKWLKDGCTLEVQPFTHLQGIGDQPAVPASELVPGDVLMWNYGYESRVDEARTSGRHVVLTMTSTTGRDHGKTFERKMAATRLVARVPYALGTEPKR